MRHPLVRVHYGFMVHVPPSLAATDFLLLTGKLLTYVVVCRTCMEDVLKLSLSLCWSSVRRVMSAVATKMLAR